jgi:hypothetical protein
MTNFLKSVIPALLLISTAAVVLPQTTQKIETLYEEHKNLTTVRLGPTRLSGEKNRYHSLDFTLSYEYSGRTTTIPQRINFDLVSVVKARRLNPDLYVVFLVDGKPIHFSSNRSAVRDPVPGRLWIGERMVFLIPYEDFLNLANAKKLSLKMGDITFDFGEAACETIHTISAALKQ